MQKLTNNVQYIRCQLVWGWGYDVENLKHTQTRRSATTHYRPWRPRWVVERQLLGKWPKGLPHLRELLLFFVCARAGAKLRPDLETTSGEEIPWPDLSLRSGRKNPFRWISRSWKLSEPTFVSKRSVHRSYTGESCTDQDLCPTSGYRLVQVKQKKKSLPHEYRSQYRVTE